MSSTSEWGSGMKDEGGAGMIIDDGCNSNVLCCVCVYLLASECPALSHLV